MHTYCVILRPQQSLNHLYRQTKRYYLNARSAAQAMLIASEDPEWVIVGIEPAWMSAAPRGAFSAVEDDVDISHAAHSDYAGYDSFLPLHW
jgi:hypothetical protein